MLKLLAKLVATWLTAFAITGATVWAGPEDDAAESGAPAASDAHPPAPQSGPPPGATP